MKMFLLIEIRKPTQASTHVRREHYAIHSTDTWLSVKGSCAAAKIKTRRAYPGTFCERQTDGSILMGYGSREVQTEDEFLHITFNVDGSICLQRDVHCMLPIFYGQSGEVVIISNEYHEVVERLPYLTLNLVNLSKNLINVTPTTQYTLWNEVNVLGERQVLYIKDNEPVFMPGATPRPWAFSTELPEVNPQAFPSMIDSRLRRFIDTRLGGNVVGVELSGGLDSAFLPLFMAANGYGTPVPAGTLVQPDPEDRDRQLQKIRQIEERTSLRSKRIHLHPGRHYPLVNVMGNSKFRPIDHAHDAYEAPTAELAEYFRNLGVEVVVTGGGGDQLLEHRPHPDVIASEQQNKPVPPFLTSLCQIPSDIYKSPVAPPTLLSSSLVYENLAQANTYINRDIWPVSPFYDVPLFNFCQALPVHFRANKNIFRAYFEASGFPEILYKGHNEYFSTFFDMCLLAGTYDALVQRLAQRSVTAKLGYVDIDKLVGLFFSIRQGTTSSEALFSIYTWMRIELNLQFISKWSLE